MGLAVGVIAAVVGVVTLVYLLIAVIRPEWF